MEGQTVGHYRVIRPLAAGGMGEVLLAEDQRLHRYVALKLLPLASMTDRDRVLRFHQEARAASALNHPNIVTIFEIGESDGRSFIATEYIEGATLRQRIEGRPMPISEVIDTAIGITSALVAAHEIGVVHRDIKPENVMLRRDGLVKVLDFGLAKLSKTRAIRHLGMAPLPSTEAGLVMGTVHYMSPEQLRGEEIDHRTDLFSLGEVVYEMVSGNSPFEGTTTSEIIAAILEKYPAPLSRFARGVPTELERIVEKLLRKDRSERYQSAREVLTDLKALKQDLEYRARQNRESGGSRTVTSDDSTDPYMRVPDPPLMRGSAPRNIARSSGSYVATGIRQNRDLIVGAVALLLIVAFSMLYFSRRSGVSYDSIAVLPFTNVARDPSVDYLADGITESIIHSLSRLQNLQVMAQSTVFRFKGQQVDPQKIGRDLNVGAVLTGKVVQRGDMLVVQADLVDVEKGTLIWGEQYNRKFSDVLTLQSDIAHEISDRLRLRLTGEQRAKLAKSYTQDPEAYRLYLKGRHQWNKRDNDSMQRAIGFFEKAIEREPGYALAWAGLADSYSLLPVYGATSSLEAFPKARAAAKRALQIDDEVAEAHTSLAWVSFQEWKWDEAEREFKRALELNPNYPTAHQWYALFLSAMGRHDEAIRQIQRALESDPLSLAITTTVGTTYYLGGRNDEAMAQFKRALDAEPSFTRARFEMARSLEIGGNFSAAIPELEAIGRSGEPAHLAALARAYGRAGRKADAEQLLDRVLKMSASEYVNPYDIAAVYAGMGERDRCFAWLNRAYEERTSRLAYLNVEPMFADLRDDVRFGELITQIGLPTAAR